LINKLFKKEQPIIEFYCRPEYEDVIPKPELAKKHIPDWFKRVKPYVGGKDDINRPGMSAKKCMPLLDAMTLGYVMPLGADLGVITNHDCSRIEIKNSGSVKSGEFHNNEQVGGKTGPGYPANPIKFINHWFVKTRPGWSTLFLPIMNDVENTMFTALAGFVDTDTFCREINFPVLWHERNYDGYVAAGTPIVVAIPIPREVIRVKEAPVRKITEQEKIDVEKLSMRQDSASSIYTNFLREPRK
jgi:hypothetical protein